MKSFQSKASRKGERVKRQQREKLIFQKGWDILCQCFINKKSDFHFGAISCFETELDGIVSKRGNNTHKWNVSFKPAHTWLWERKGPFHWEKEKAFHLESNKNLSSSQGYFSVQLFEQSVWVQQNAARDTKPVGYFFFHHWENTRLKSIISFLKAHQIFHPRVAKSKRQPCFNLQ